MVHMLIRHKVQDFDHWKRAYDAHRHARTAAGLRELHLWHDAGDPNALFLLFEIADLAQAKAFAASPELKEKMTAAGVTGAPDIFFLSGEPGGS